MTRVNQLLVALLQLSAAELAAELEAARFHEQQALQQGKPQTAALWADVLQFLERLKGVLDER